MYPKSHMETNEKYPRRIFGHEGSGLNDATVIQADARDENGGSHEYLIRHPAGPQGGDIREHRVSFQNGPISVVGFNGLTDEALLAVLIDRLDGFDTGPFRCRENSLARTHMQEAMHWLQHRTKERQRRAVEGSHEV